MNVFCVLDLLFLKNHEHLFKSLNLYFSNESSVTEISVSGRPWNDLFLDGGLRPNTFLGFKFKTRLDLWLH